MTLLILWALSKRSFDILPGVAIWRTLLHNPKFLLIIVGESFYYSLNITSLISLFGSYLNIRRVEYINWSFNFGLKLIDKELLTV